MQQNSDSSPHVRASTSSDVKPRLIKNLRQAAEIEQQFMCMYLYGAYSIKKRYVDGQFPEQAQPDLERYRRWASTVYTVARQEMEHLALANNLLRAIGAAPHFARDNLQRHGVHADNQRAGQHFTERFFFGPETATPASAGLATAEAPTPIAHPFRFTPFTLDAVKNWTCMEAPDFQTLVEQDPNKVARWCFNCGDNEERRAPQDIAPGTISELYAEILRDFECLTPDDYITPSSEQVEIIQQYDIYVFPVTDYASARQAIDLIIKQGEGNTSSITYPSHYRRFFDIVEDYHPNSRFSAYWQLLDNPSATDIDNPTTRQLFELSNQAYELLLVLLTTLYASANQHPTKAPYFAPALGQEAFAPIMTMIIRSCGELLVQLAANAEGRRVGPGFIISREVEALLRQPFVGIDADCELVGNAPLRPELGDIDHILARFERFNQGLAQVQLQSGDVVDAKLFDWATERLDYMRQNAVRIQTNLARIYQDGIFKGFQTDGY